MEINCVQSLLMSCLSLEQKIAVKKKGRPTPDLEINSSSVSKTRTYNRVFNRNIYNKYEWMCGCPATNKLFCFMCLIFKKEMTAWNNLGVNDLRHMADRAKKHESSISHMNACMDFGVLGEAHIRQQLDYVYLKKRTKQDENVEKKRHILRRSIMGIQFCQAFELALKKNSDETSSPIDFSAEIDAVLKAHKMEKFQEELLDSMLKIYKEEILKEIETANVVSLIVDEIVGVSNHGRVVLMVVRYVSNGQIFERFWRFLRQEDTSNSEVLAGKLVEEMSFILKFGGNNDKLISQSYNIAIGVNENTRKVEEIVKDTFPCAHYVHCYSHDFYSIVERIVQQNRRVKKFFACLQSFFNFFSSMDEIVKRLELPKTATSRWVFNSRSVNTLFENKETIKESLKLIIEEDSIDSGILSEAIGLLNHLNCNEFLYWLKLFHSLTPNIEMLFSQAGTRDLNVEKFQQQVSLIRNTIPETEDDRSAIAKALCESISTSLADRFAFKDHLSAAELFTFRNFANYKKSFPQVLFEETVRSFPMLDDVKLKNELSAIYGRDDVPCDASGVLPFLVFLADNKLKSVLTETYKLLVIICTTPMLTEESERCFFVGERIRTFLRNTKFKERLDVLAVLSIEKKFVQSIPDFENKVIDVFSTSMKKNNGRLGFVYEEESKNNSQSSDKKSRKPFIDDTESPSVPAKQRKTGTLESFLVKEESVFQEYDHPVFIAGSSSHEENFMKTEPTIEGISTVCNPEKMSDFDDVNKGVEVKKEPAEEAFCSSVNQPSTSATFDNVDKFRKIGNYVEENLRLMDADQAEVAEGMIYRIVDEGLSNRLKGGDEEYYLDIKKENCE